MFQYIILKPKYLRVLNLEFYASALVHTVSCQVSSSNVYVNNNVITSQQCGSEAEGPIINYLYRSQLIEAGWLG